MEDGPKLARLDRRIRRSKRQGKMVFAAVVLGSLGLGAVLVQGLVLAGELGRQDLLVRAWVGLALLGMLDLFAGLLVWRQHRILDEARMELQELVTGQGFD